MKNNNDIYSSEQKASAKRKTIDELFESYTGDYTPCEIDWGEPVGKEVW